MEGTIKIKQEPVEKETEPNKSQVKRKISSSPVKKKKALKIKKEFPDFHGKQAFRKSWTQLPEFKGWLIEGLLPYHGYCQVCHVNITAHKMELLSHSKSRKHMNNALIENTKSSASSDLTRIVDESGSTHFLRIIDLRSDSLSNPTREMRQAMIEAPCGDTAFKTDKTVVEFETAVTQLLNKEMGLFFPTHTMANLAAVLTHCQARGSAVIAGDQTDISVNNQEALIKFGGIHFNPVQELSNGTLCLEKLECMLKAMDISYPLSCLVCFECAHARRGGRVPSTDWIDQVASLCSSSGALLHCDGTRLGNAALASSLAPSQMVKGCDSVTFAIDKALGAPIGAVLVGKEEFIKRATNIRNFLGGNIHQAGIFAAAGNYALDERLPCVDFDHAKAKSIAIAVAMEDNPFLSVEMSTVQTNVLNLNCKPAVWDASQVKDRLASVNEEETESCDGESIIVLGQVINPRTLSFMLHNSVSQNDVRSIIKKILYIIKEHNENEL